MIYPCPDEIHLKLLISEAFNDLPAPDGMRLGQIGTALGQQTAFLRPARQTLKTWLLWLLLGAATTATAWWVGDRLFRDDNPAVDEINMESAPAAKTLQPGTVAERTEQENSTSPAGADKRNGPIIDRREQY